MELVKLTGAEFGIEETKAQEISAQFKPMLDKMVELEKEYNKIVKMPKDRPETAEKAGDLRRKLVKVRTGTAEIHKAQKAFYLAGGRFVDAWKNAQLFASEGLEKKLLEIETYQQRKEAERVENLRIERTELIQPYVSDIDHVTMNFGAMQADVWEAYFEKKKKDFEELQEAKRKAEEQERLEKEKAERVSQRRKALEPYSMFIEISHTDDQLAEMDQTDFDQIISMVQQLKRIEEIKVERANERIQKLQKYGTFVDWDKDWKEIEETEFLQIWNEAKQKAEESERKAKEAEELKQKMQKRGEMLRPYLMFISDYNQVLSLSDEQFEKDFQELKKGAEAHWEFEAQEKVRKDKEEQERKAEKEKHDARLKKLQDELKAKKDAEEKAKAEEKAEKERKQKEAEELAKAGDVAILKNWVDGFLVKGLGAENLSDESIKKANEILEKFSAFKAWAYGIVEK